MKYIDSEKLIAEIERRRLSNRYIDTEGYENELLEIITSLQQEPRFPQYDNIVDKVFGAGNLEGFEYREAEMLVALAKEELLKSLQQEQPSLPSNLDEAANNYGVDIRLGYPRVMDETDRYIYNAFKAGAEWLAGQGENKEGDVLDHDEFIKFSDGTYIDLDPTQGLIPAFKIKDGDKVVVQIRKK